MLEEHKVALRKAVEANGIIDVLRELSNCVGRSDYTYGTGKTSIEACWDAHRDNLLWATVTAENISNEQTKRKKDDYWYTPVSETAPN